MKNDELLKATVDKRRARAAEYYSRMKRIKELRDEVVRVDPESLDKARIVALEIERLRKLNQAGRGQIRHFDLAIEHLKKEARDESEKV